MNRPRRHYSPFAGGLRAALWTTIVALFCLGLGAAALAQEGAVGAGQVGNSSGLPLPRFVTVSAAPVNVRVGPGTNYEIAWTFLKPRMPVEVIEEFDTWRQIRDVEGDTGWVHQSLLTGERTGLTRPDGDQVALLSTADAESAPRAWLTAGLQVEISACEGAYCEIALTHAQDGRNTTYRGFVAREALYGVYPDEVFD